MSNLKLPGLIDIHVHLRTPGQEHKEDFTTGTSAAIAGGFTTVLDMPNNEVPITTLGKLRAKIELARQNAVCDVGFYFGSLGDNFQEFDKIKQLVFGIKLYLNVTTGNFLIDEVKLAAIYSAWPGHQPILLHCEGETLPMALKIIRQTNKKTHICHVSGKDELSQIIRAKQAGLPITCGVTPHHLFLTEEDAKKLGPYGRMKPFLKTKTDQNFLWENLKWIDAVESDHAPHTTVEKEFAKNPPFGVPGLETTLPLLLTAVFEGKLTLDDVIRLCHTNPTKIFNIPTDEQTYVEIDPDEQYTINNKHLFTKCGWSPFKGKSVKGKVKKVFLRGEKVFDNGQILTQPGSGKVIYPSF
ncbi:amidohydrolase family protein [Candidatus Daviesbacteria bacterium]|nr:amidohydrolase family protein [Candidatus Daviesbacteria bacterium]